MSEKLCYVEGAWAYFTTQSLADQWGDDWDDAPYEHNAGTPYSDWKGDGSPAWEISKVAWESPLVPPCEGQCNSRWCVRDINNGDVAWLSNPPWNKSGHFEPIFAGVSLAEFTRLIEASGGTVFLPSPIGVKAMTHSEQALQWLSEGKTVLLAGKEVTKHCAHSSCDRFWIEGFEVMHDFLDILVDAGLPLTDKEPEPKVIRLFVEPSTYTEGYTFVSCHIKGNVTEAQVKAALESIGGKQ